MHDYLYMNRLRPQQLQQAMSSLSPHPLLQTTHHTTYIASNSGVIRTDWISRQSSSIQSKSVLSVILIPLEPDTYESTIVASQLASAAHTVYANYAYTTAIRESILRVLAWVKHGDVVDVGAITDMLQTTLQAHLPIGDLQHIHHYYAIRGLLESVKEVLVTLIDNKMINLHQDPLQLFQTFQRIPKSKLIELLNVWNSVVIASVSRVFAYVQVSWLHRYQQSHVVSAVLSRLGRSLEDIVLPDKHATSAQKLHYIGVLVYDADKDAYAVTSATKETLPDVILRYYTGQLPLRRNTPLPALADKDVAVLQSSLSGYLHYVIGNILSLIKSCFQLVFYIIQSVLDLFGLGKLIPRIFNAITPHSDLTKYGFVPVMIIIIAIITAVMFIVA